MLTVAFYVFTTRIKKQKIQNFKFVSLKSDFPFLWSIYLWENPIRLSSYTFDGQERDKVVDYSQWE